VFQPLFPSIFHIQLFSYGSNPEKLAVTRWIKFYPIASIFIWLLNSSYWWDFKMGIIQIDPLLSPKFYQPSKEAYYVQS
jgi:hypothetical protein